MGYGGTLTSSGLNNSQAISVNAELGQRRLNKRVSVIPGSQAPFLFFSFLTPCSLFKAIPLRQKGSSLDILQPNSTTCLSLFYLPALGTFRNSKGLLPPLQESKRKPKTTSGNVLTSCFWVWYKYTQDVNHKSKQRELSSLCMTYQKKIIKKLQRHGDTFSGSATRSTCVLLFTLFTHGISVYIQWRSNGVAKGGQGLPTVAFKPNLQMYFFATVPRGMP